MELHFIDIAIILTYMLGMIVVGFVVERKARGGIDNYFLGGHKMPWWILSMSNAASMFATVPARTLWLSPPNPTARRPRGLPGADRCDSSWLLDVNGPPVAWSPYRRG